MSNCYKDHKILLSTPDGKEEPLAIPVRGIKSTDIKLMTKRAFKSATDHFDASEQLSGTSQIILLALSCELFLKAILMKITGEEVKKEHDLHILFYEELPPEQRSLIISLFNPSKWTEDEIENMTMLHANCFVDLRYDYELGIYVYNKGFLRVFASCLEKACESIYGIQKISLRPKD